MTNVIFKEYVTSTAFHLTLSKNMIYVLDCIMRRSTDYSLSHWVTATKRLGARGLVVHTSPGDMTPPWSKYPWKVTAAGKLVYKLLLEANLIERIREDKRAA